MRSYYQNLTDFFEQNSKAFDAVHCNYQSLINTDILKFAKKYGIKVRIAHAHNSGYGKEPGMKQKLLIFKNRVTLGKYATHYFACSPLAAAWMFGERPATIIKNAIDAEKFIYSEEKRIRARAELGLEGAFAVMFVGRFDPQKNPLFLLEIFNELHKKAPDSKLIITGDGVLREEMVDKTQALALSDSVIMTGSRSDVNELLQAADAFLLPSKFEGLGIVLIEAQAAGLETYTSDKVVPSDARVTDLLHFISLDEPAEHWADVILQNRNAERCNMENEIKAAGYDNRENAQKLKKLYWKAVVNTL